MKKDMIIQAWKDPAYRARLSAEERASLPECPAGRPLTELDEGSLGEVVGGYLSPDQDISDFPARFTPVISVNNFVRFDAVANLAATKYRQY
jgi:mersacidin/lichenicidin family type 2 lantibiotic